MCDHRTVTEAKELRGLREAWLSRQTWDGQSAFSEMEVAWQCLQALGSGILCPESVCPACLGEGERVLVSGSQGCGAASGLAFDLDTPQLPHLQSQV